MKRYGSFAGAVFTLAVAALSGHVWAANERTVGRPDVVGTVEDCRMKLVDVKSNAFAKVIDVTTRCLAVPDLSIVARSLLLKARADAYAEQHDKTSAIADLEEAFRLVPPKTGWEIISLASIYYEASRYSDAVTLIQGGMRQEIGMTGRGSGFGMPLYYHLGRSLVALNRNEEAVEALSAGIPAQPDFAYAYWYRSLAYSNLHDDIRAKADLEQFVRWVDPEKLTDVERRRLVQHGMEGRLGSGNTVNPPAVLAEVSKLQSVLPAGRTVAMAKITMASKNDKFPDFGPFVLEIKPKADGTTHVHEVYGPNFTVDREIAGFMQLKSKMNGKTTELSGGLLTQNLNLEVSTWTSGAHFSYKSEASGMGSPIFYGLSCTIGQPVGAKSLHVSLAGRAWPLDCKDLKGGNRNGYYVEELRYFVEMRSESKDFGTTNLTIDSVVVER